MNTAPRDAQKRKEEAAAAFNSTLGQTVYKMGVSIAQQMAIQAVRAVEAMRGGPQAVLYWDQKTVPASVQELSIRPKAKWFCLVPAGVEMPEPLRDYSDNPTPYYAVQVLTDGTSLICGPVA